MKQQQHIPTIIALLFLILGLGSVVFLVEYGSSFFAQAQSSTEPQNVTTSNISEKSFSVSWTTDDQARGVISYAKKNGKQFVALDDRDDTNSQKRNLHHVTINNLSPSTLYLFTIISNGKTHDNNGEPFRIQTANTISGDIPTHAPIYGNIKKANDQPASETLIYFTTTTSQTRSTISSNNGRFVLPISPLRDQSLNQYISLTDDTIATITIHGTDGNISRITTPIANTNPLPAITLGKTYDFHNFEGFLSSPIANILKYIKQAAMFFIPNVYAATQIAITQPEENSGIPSQTPEFKGTGIAYKELIATVGTPVQTGKIWIDKNGTWSWTPPQPLSTDQHILTITTTNESGQPVALSRTFIILKSGSSVLDAATPSATLTPSPTTSPTASASSQPVPVSGNTYPTFAVLLSGLVLLLIGTFTFVVI